MRPDLFIKKRISTMIALALFSAGLGSVLAQGGKSMKLSFGEGISKEDRRTKFGRFHVALPDDPQLQLSTALPKGWKDFDLNHSKIKGSGPDVKVLGLYTPDTKTMITMIPSIMVTIEAKPASIPLKEWISEQWPAILDMQIGTVETHRAAHILAQPDLGYTRAYLEELPGNRVIILAGSTINPADLETLSLVCAASHMERRPQVPSNDR
jgi:hypothetical protein